MASAPRVVERRCVSCRLLTDRRGLWRVVRPSDGSPLQLDGGMGRSAYLCPSASCLEEAQRRRRLQRALRCAVDDSLMRRLQERLDSAGPASAEAR